MLTRLVPEVGQWVVQTRRVVKGLGERRDRVTHHASTMRHAMHAVVKPRIPQSVQGSTTGVVAQGNIVQAGVTHARALVRNQAGKQGECGLPSLLRRLGGG